MFGAQVILWAMKVIPAIIRVEIMEAMFNHATKCDFCGYTSFTLYVSLFSNHSLYIVLRFGVADFPTQ